MLFRRTTVILSALLIVGLLFTIAFVGLEYHLYAFARSTVIQKMKPILPPTLPQS
jgi:hypothetical protein